MEKTASTSHIWDLVFWTSLNFSEVGQKSWVKSPKHWATGNKSPWRHSAILIQMILSMTVLFLKGIENDWKKIPQWLIPLAEISVQINHYNTVFWSGQTPRDRQASWDTWMALYCFCLNDSEMNQKAQWELRPLLHVGSAMGCSLSF